MSHVLVSHPHAAEIANRTARALEARGWLARYDTGVAGSSSDGLAGRVLRGLARARPVLENRIVSGVPSARLRGRAAVELAGRAVGRLAGRASGGEGAVAYDALFAAFDAAVAASAWPRGVDAVLAYEDAAHLTFLRAERAGVRRFLDMPAPAARAVAEILRAEHARWPGAERSPRLVEPAWKLRRKAAELALADVVLAASTFSAITLAREGRSAVVTPYGFPVDTFPAKRAVSGPATVLAVGALSVRKGTPVLLEAWRRAGLRGARLVLVGRLDLSPSFLDRYAGSFEHVPNLPRAQLGALYRGADLVVFPAVADGFGLVILEAMASGTPVIASRASGAPDCITEGVDGFLVSAGDVDALAEGLRFALGDRDRLFAMGRRARLRAESRPWDRASREYTNEFSGSETTGRVNRSGDI